MTHGTSWPTVLGMACLSLGVAAATIWGALAIYYSNLPGERLRLALAAAFVLGTVAAFLLLPSWRLALVVFGSDPPPPSQAAASAAISARRPRDETETRELIFLGRCGSPASPDW